MGVSASAPKKQTEQKLSTCNERVRVVTNPASQPKQPGWTRFVCFSDTHGLEAQIPPQSIVVGDVLLHAGDFSNTGQLKEVKLFADWLASYPARTKVVIAGNHDTTFHEEYYLKTGAQRFHNKPYEKCGKDARALFARDGIVYLEDNACKVETDAGVYTIYGSPWQPEFCDWAFNLPPGEELARKWALIPPVVDILMTHGPPNGYCDMTSRGIRAGCTELRTAIESRAIPVHVFGHIHSGYGVFSDSTTDSTTTYVNASTCNESYKPINPPIVFDLAPPESFR